MGGGVEIQNIPLFDVGWTDRTVWVRRSSDAGRLLGQRLWRWPNTLPASVFVFAGIWGGLLTYSQERLISMSLLKTLQVWALR